MVGVTGFPLDPRDDDSNSSDDDDDSMGDGSKGGNTLGCVWMNLVDLILLSSGR